MSKEKKETRGEPNKGNCETVFKAPETTSERRDKPQSCRGTLALLMLSHVI